MSKDKKEKKDKKEEPEEELDAGYYCALKDERRAEYRAHFRKMFRIEDNLLRIHHCIHYEEGDKESRDGMLYICLNGMYFESPSRKPDDPPFVFTIAYGAVEKVEISLRIKLTITTLCGRTHHFKKKPHSVAVDDPLVYFQYWSALIIKHLSKHTAVIIRPEEDDKPPLSSSDSSSSSLSLRHSDDDGAPTERLDLETARLALDRVTMMLVQLGENYNLLESQRETIEGVIDRTLVIQSNYKRAQKTLARIKGFFSGIGSAFKSSSSPALDIAKTPDVLNVDLSFPIILYSKTKGSLLSYVHRYRAYYDLGVIKFASDRFCLYDESDQLIKKGDTKKSQVLFKDIRTIVVCTPLEFALETDSRSVFICSSYIQSILNELVMRDSSTRSLITFSEPSLQFPLGAIDYRQLYDPETGGSRAEFVSLVPLFRDKRTRSDMAEFEEIERRINELVDLCLGLSAEIRSNLDHQIASLEALNQRLDEIVDHCGRLAVETRHQSYRE